MRSPETTWVVRSNQKVTGDRSPVSPVVVTRLDIIYVQLGCLSSIDPQFGEKKKVEIKIGSNLGEIVVLKSILMHYMVVVKEIQLICALLGVGGGGQTAPCLFPSIAQNGKEYIYGTFRTSSDINSAHVDQRQFHIYNRSAVNGVRVTSCSAILDKNKGLRESLPHAHF